jgi:hypothetical protein
LYAEMGRCRNRLALPERGTTGRSLAEVARVVYNQSMKRDITPRTFSRESDRSWK